MVEMQSIEVQSHYEFRLNRAKPFEAVVAMFDPTIRRRWQDLTTWA